MNDTTLLVVAHSWQPERKFHKKNTIKNNNSHDIKPMTVACIVGGERMMLPHTTTLDVGLISKQVDNRRSPNTVTGMPLVEDNHNINTRNNSNESYSIKNNSSTSVTKKSPRVTLLNPQKQPRYDNNWDESTTSSSSSSSSSSESDDDDDDFSMGLPTDNAKRRRIHDSDEENDSREQSSDNEIEIEEESEASDDNDESFIDDSRLQEEAISSPPSTVRFVHQPTTKKKKRTQVLWNNDINRNKRRINNILTKDIKNLTNQRSPGGRQPPSQRKQQQENKQKSKFPKKMMTPCKQAGKHPKDQSQEQKRKNAATTDTVTRKRDNKTPKNTPAADCHYKPKLLPIGTKLRRMYNTGWFDGEIIEAYPSFYRVRYDYNEIEVLYDDEEVLLGAVAYVLKYSPKYKNTPIKGMGRKATELSTIGEGTLLRKKYEEGWFQGVVCQHCATTGTWFVRYEDEQEEAMKTDEVNMCTVAYLLHTKPEYCEDLLRLVIGGIDKQTSNDKAVIDLTVDDDKSPAKKRASLKPTAKRGAFDDDARAKLNDTQVLTPVKKGGANKKRAASKCPGSPGVGDVINSRAARRSSKRSKVLPTGLVDRQGNDTGGDHESKLLLPESKEKSPTQAKISAPTASCKRSKFKKRRVVGTSIRKRWDTGWFNGEIIKKTATKTQVKYADNDTEDLSDEGAFKGFSFASSLFRKALTEIVLFTELDVAIGSYDIHTQKLRQASPGPGSRVRKRYDQGYVNLGL